MIINFLHLLFFLLLTVLFPSHWYAARVSSDQSKLLFNGIASYSALSLEDHLFYNAIPELISASEHVTLCGSPKAVNPSHPPHHHPPAPSPCSLWIYRSVGVSHRVWFMIAWLMRISILYGLLTSTAHKVHSVLFSVIQGHETGKRTDFSWIMESLSSSRINKILLQTPVKGLLKPLGSEGTL